MNKEDIPILKWKKNHIEGTNDSYFILVGFGSYIFSFYLMIKYNSEAKEYGVENEPLTNFINTDIIDWSNISLKSYLTFVL